MVEIIVAKGTTTPSRTALSYAWILGEETTVLIQETCRIARGPEEFRPSVFYCNLRLKYVFQE